MIEKVEGNIRVDKLRTLLLMEAEFNSLNKLIFSSRMIKGMENKNICQKNFLGAEF